MTGAGRPPPIIAFVLASASDDDGGRERRNGTTSAARDEAGPAPLVRLINMVCRLCQDADMLAGEPDPGDMSVGTDEYGVRAEIGALVSVRSTT